MERDLKTEKRMNKAVMVLIVIMIILICVLVADLAHLEKKYEQLEGRYIELYDELSGK